jgi:hypothetical protein
MVYVHILPPKGENPSDSASRVQGIVNIVLNRRRRIPQQSGLLGWSRCWSPENISPFGGFTYEETKSDLVARPAHRLVGCVVSRAAVSFAPYKEPLDEREVRLPLVV